jgi:NADH-quinone oxidoreductase subunit G
MLGLKGFDFETSEDVRAEALGDVAGIASRLANGSGRGHGGAAMPSDAVGNGGQSSGQGNGLERISDVPIYATDSLVRRASSLQLTADARPAAVSVPETLWSQLGLSPGASVRVTQDGAQAVLTAQLDTTLAAGTVRVPAGVAATAMLGAMFGAVTVDKV